MFKVILLVALFSTQLAFGQATRRNFSKGINAKALEKLNEYQRAGRRIDAFTFTRSGRWLIVAENARYYSDRKYFDRLKGKGSVSLRSKLEEYIKSGRKIDIVAITNQGNWIIVAGKFRAYSSASAFDNIGLRPVLNRLINQGKKIQSISVSDNKKWAIVADGRAYGNNLGKEMGRILDSALYQEQRRIRSVQFRPGRKEWVIVADYQYWSSDPIRNRARVGVRNFRRRNLSIDHFVLDNANGISLVSNNQFNIRSNDFGAAIELTLQSRNGGTRTLWDAMKMHKVPGVAIAIIHNNKLQSVRGFGRRRGTKGRVFFDTLFPVASMSKAVASFGIMKSVEKGVVSLRQTPLNVGDKFPNSKIADWIDLIDDRDTNSNGTQFFRAQDIRIQDLLSHTAGMDTSGIGLWSIPAPSASDIILGTGRVQTGVFPSVGDPRRQWSYSGGGYSLAEVMMETISGKSFGRLMMDNVLKPLGMTKSTFGKLSVNQQKELAYGHTSRLLPLSYRECPGKGAGGLFSTALDYARFVHVLLNEGRKRPGSSTMVLRSDLVDRLLTPAAFDSSSRSLCSTSANCQVANEVCIRNRCLLPIPGRGGNSYSGLGVELNMGMNQNNEPRTFWHGGTQRGYRSFFMASPSRQSALIILTNGFTSWSLTRPDGSTETRGATVLIREIQNTFINNHW